MLLRTSNSLTGFQSFISLFTLQVYVPSRSALVMANRDFVSRGCYESRGCYGYPNMSHDMLQHKHYFDSPCRSSLSGVPALTDSSHCVSSTSYDGNRGVVEEKKCVTYHEDGLSCDHFRRFHGRSCSCEQRCSQSTGYERRSCGYEEKGYAAAKCSVGGEHRRYW